MIFSVSFLLSLLFSVSVHKVLKRITCTQSDQLSPFSSDSSHQKPLEPTVPGLITMWQCREKLPQQPHPHTPEAPEGNSSLYWALTAPRLHAWEARLASPCQCPRKEASSGSARTGQTLRQLWGWAVWGAPKADFPSGSPGSVSFQGHHGAGEKGWEGPTENPATPLFLQSFSHFSWINVL